jgi:hypothetical protein
MCLQGRRIFIVEHVMVMFTSLTNESASRSSPLLSQRYDRFDSVSNAGFPLEEVLTTDTTDLIERGEGYDDDGGGGGGGFGGEGGDGDGGDDSSEWEVWPGDGESKEGKPI